MRHISEYLLKGSSLASIGTLLIVSICSGAHPAGHEIGTRSTIQMEQPEKKSAFDIPLPPIDKIVPHKTETATFALG
jgi:hypothetical protein